MAKPELKTEHPYIVLIPCADRAEPYIKGTRIAVRHVVQQYHLYRDINRVLDAYPHLSLAQVHDALSYYYDHQDEIDNFMRLNTEAHWTNAGQ